MAPEPRPGVEADVRAGADAGQAAGPAQQETAAARDAGMPPGTAVQVSVCYALADGAWQRSLALPAGSTVRDAIAASGFAQAHPGLDPYAHGIAIFGALRGPEHVLEEGERIDILRPLTFDPMESRRRRARHKAAKQARAAGG